VIWINRYFPLTVAFIALSWTFEISADVIFSGLETGQEANVRALMPLASTGCDSAPWRIERLFRDADKNVRMAVEALGYYDISIAKTLIRSDDCWRASFEIVVGEPVRLRQVDVLIEGAAADDSAFQSRLSANRPVPGEILNHGRYDKYKATLLTAAITSGYFDADFERSEVSVDREAKVADIVLRLQSGTRYRFGQVSFSEGILRDSLLMGYSDIRTGDPYSAKAINDLYEALNGSAYFESVSISTEPLDTSDKTVPVKVALTPGTRRIYSIGAGYATDTGLQGRLGYANRRRNDKGHQFESKLNASPVKSELTAAYRWPIRDPRQEWLSVVAGVQYEDTDTSESDSYKLGILRSHNVSASWLETRYLDFAFENFKVGDQDTSSRLIIFGVNRESAKGRELGRVTNGRRLSFDIRGASDSLGSDTSFLQFRSTAKWIRSLGEKTRILSRTSLGLTVEEEFAELPASVRFFAGGDLSVRGYEYESLGPTDAVGDVIGGSHLLTGSLEIDRLVRPQWAIAAFVDSGSAFNDSDIEFSTGAGLGIRWYSPIGPVRLDIAHPFDDPDEDFRIHLSLGPDL
jgi:translocation and assembly module TamA